MIFIGFLGSVSFIKLIFGLFLIRSFCTAPSGCPVACFKLFSNFQNVCATLRNRGEVHSVSKVFAQCNTDDERMRYVLEQNFANCLKWKECNFVKKDKSESHRLRDLGNQVGCNYNNLVGYASTLEAQTTTMTSPKPTLFQ